jgi:hypothetical protein
MSQNSGNLKMRKSDEEREGREERGEGREGGEGGGEEEGKEVETF